MNHEKEQGRDETVVEKFRRKWKMTVYIEKAPSNMAEEVFGIGRSGDYDLMVVGKGRFPLSMVVKLAKRQADEHTELGPIGDILASLGQGVWSSVLFIQQHDVELANESPVSKAPIENDESSRRKGNLTSVCTLFEST